MFAMAAWASAFLAEMKSISSDWKPCRGRDIALRVNKRLNEHVKRDTVLESIKLLINLLQRKAIAVDFVKKDQPPSHPRVLS